MSAKDKNTLAYFCNWRRKKSLKHHPQERGEAGSEVRKEKEEDVGTLKNVLARKKRRKQQQIFKILNEM